MIDTELVSRSRIDGTDQVAISDASYEQFLAPVSYI
jgi:hypothetical protein